MAHYAGTSGDVIWGSTALEVTGWSATENAAALGTTDKGSGGYREAIAGIKSIDADVKGQWNSEIHEDDPPLVRAGLIVTLSLEIQGGGESIDGSFLIVSVDYTNETEGVVEYGFKAQSTGAYSLPGESGS